MIANDLVERTGLASNDNTVYNNNFVDNTNNAELSGVNNGNLFNLLVPTGGNYWSDNFSCVDDDVDGYCDSPFVFSGGQDNLPYTKQNGWAPPTIGVGNAPVDIANT